MKVAIRMGHLSNVDQGANGIVSEYDVNRAYTPYVITALKRAGIEAVDVTPQSAISMSDSLCQGVDRANNAGADLFVSCHVNAEESADAKGCEVIYYPGSEYGKTLGIFISREIESLGFYNRGTKEDVRGLYELKATNMPAVIVEPFFCTSQNDVDVYTNVGAKELGEAIAKGILGFLGKDFIPETIKEDEASGIVTFTQVYGGKLEAIFSDSNGNEYIGTVKLDNIIKKG